MEPLEPVNGSPPAVAPGSDPAPRSPGGMRRLTATAALALGLMLAGGTAVVLAASPDPTASSAPSTAQPTTDPSSGTDPAPTTAPATGTPPSAGTGARNHRDCPDGAGTGSAPSTGTNPAPTTAPSTAPTTTTPSATPADGSQL